MCSDSSHKATPSTPVHILNSTTNSSTHSILSSSPKSYNPEITVQCILSTLTHPPPLTQTESFYKRTLPQTCIQFNSSRGIQLFKTSLSENHLHSYFSLSMQFLTQSEPAYCGLASLCMVLNAFGVDPKRNWKGVWRWYDEHMLDKCQLESACFGKCGVKSVEDMKVSGISLV